MKKFIKLFLPLILLFNIVLPLSPVLIHPVQAETAADIVNIASKLVSGRSSVAATTTLVTLTAATNGKKYHAVSISVYTDTATTSTVTIENGSGVVIWDQIIPAGSGKWNFNLPELVGSANTAMIGRITGAAAACKVIFVAALL